MTRGSAYVGPSHSESPAWYLDLAFAVLVSLLETSLLWWAYHRCTVALELSHPRGSGHSVAPSLSSSSSTSADPSRKPQSVNYHFTRQCNYQCGFCFHTAKTSFVLPMDEAKRGLRMLCEAG